MAKLKPIVIKSDDEFDFSVYGILSNDLADFQLAMALNDTLRWNLHSYLPMEDQTADPPYKFHFFGEHNQSGHFQIALWKNWQNDQIFNPELKTIQYFIRVTGEWGELQSKQLLDALKQIVGNTNAIHIKVELLKNPEYFLFQIMSKEQLEEKKIIAKLRESNLN